MEERNRHLERKIDEMARLVKQNNRMLKQDRALRTCKTLIIIAVLVGGSGYGYYLFTQYQSKIIEFQEKVNELHTQTQKILQLGAQVKETARSFSDVFTETGVTDYPPVKADE